MKDITKSFLELLQPYQIKYNMEINKINSENLKLNNIKKLLYKNKPIATKRMKLPTGYYYETIIDDKPIGFIIPEEEMRNEEGKQIIGDTESAQLLIRWLVLNENINF